MKNVWRAPVELALYRMAQEALKQCVSSCAGIQASLSELSIRYQDETVELEISDNGIGFETPTTPADFAPSGHFGLLGMYERADLIGAKLRVNLCARAGHRAKNCYLNIGRTAYSHPRISALMLMRGCLYD